MHDEFSWNQNKVIFSLKVI